MSESSKRMVQDLQKKMNLKISGDALVVLSDTLDELCTDILSGAEKIREYAKKPEIDKEAVQVAAYVDARLKHLKSFHK
jgi:histone H3/H4